MPNRLTVATSPYLLQHADNPVDWWEWSPEAFAEAKARNVPILLSVGYAACHWSASGSLQSSPTLRNRASLRYEIGSAALDCGTGMPGRFSTSRTSRSPPLGVAYQNDLLNIS